MLWPLALAQMTSWGTLYFSFPLVTAAMQRELGWTQTATNVALTCGLLVTGIVAYPVGVVLDRHGGRLPMTLGSLGAGVLLASWPHVHALPMFFALWIALGACMAGCLMEPLLAVLNQVFGSEARRAIIASTMVIGLAGTVFVPAIGYMIPHLGWRHTLYALAALNLFFTTPVHWLFIPPRTGPARSRHPFTDRRGRALMRQRLRNPVFWGLALWYTSYSLTSSALIFQFVPVLRAEGVADSVIFSAFALIGPMQAVARTVVVALFGQLSTARLGAITSNLVPLAMLVLAVGPHDRAWLYGFACCFATGHGITTILRGTAPIEWLGREHFARTMGALALPMMIAMASAPTLTAWIWSVAGDGRHVLWAMFAFAAAGPVGYWVAALARRAAMTREAITA